MPLFEYNCECGRKEQYLLKEPPKNISCICGKQMKRDWGVSKAIWKCETGTASDVKTQNKTNIQSA